MRSAALFFLLCNGVFVRLMLSQPGPEEIRHSPGLGLGGGWPEPQGLTIPEQTPGLKPSSPRPHPCWHHPNPPASGAPFADSAFFSLLIKLKNSWHVLACSQGRRWGWAETPIPRAPFCHSSPCTGFTSANTNSTPPPHLNSRCHPLELLLATLVLGAAGQERMRPVGAAAGFWPFHEALNSSLAPTKGT